MEEFQPFTTSEFTLGDLYGDILPEADNSGSSLDISGDDLLTDNFTGLTKALIDSILSETGKKNGFSIIFKLVEIVRVYTIDETDIRSRHIAVLILNGNTKYFTRIHTVNV